jgi:hypothetical protein
MDLRMAEGELSKKDQSAFSIESMIRSILDFGGPEKTFFRSSSEKFFLKKEITSILSFQQPIIFLQGNPSFIEVQ